jgi:hypothetical protein
MVGWMGGCCCGPPNPPPSYCSGSYLTSFSDDFSPTFDPDWLIVSQLVADAGICRATGQWAVGFPGITTGYAFARFQKETLAGKIEVTVKLVDWQDLPLLPGNTYQAFLPFGSPSSIPSTDLNVAAYRTASLSQYVWSYGGLIEYSGVPPADGDTFGYRLSNFVEVVPLPGIVRPQLGELLRNGVTIWSTTNQNRLPQFVACDFQLGLGIWQVAFPAGVPFPGQSIIKLDDFEVVCE